MNISLALLVAAFLGWILKHTARRTLDGTSQLAPRCPPGRLRPRGINPVILTCGENIMGEVARANSLGALVQFQNCNHRVIIERNHPLACVCLAAPHCK